MGPAANRAAESESGIAPRRIPAREFEAERRLLSIAVETADRSSVDLTAAARHAAAASDWKTAVEAFDSAAERKRPLLCVEAAGETLGDAGVLRRLVGDGADLLSVPTMPGALPESVVVTASLPWELYVDGNGDPRVSAERALAAGCSAVGGGPLSGPRVMMTEVRPWQYVDRLAAWYAALGVVVHRSYDVGPAESLTPPCVGISRLVLQALLGAEQGIRHMSLRLSSNLNVLQDVAAVRALVRVTGDYLGRFGFDDVTAIPALATWRGPLPAQEGDAAAAIGVGVFTAVYASCGELVVSVPSAVAAEAQPHAAADPGFVARMSSACLDIASQQKYPESSALDDEVDQIVNEVRAILESLLSDDDPMGAVVQQVASFGLLDVASTPEGAAMGLAVSARDELGAVRLFHAGRLPLPLDVVQFHADCLEHRARSAGAPVSLEFALEDAGMKVFDSRELAESLR